MGEFFSMIEERNYPIVYLFLQRTRTPALTNGLYSYGINMVLKIKGQYLDWIL